MHFSWNKKNVARNLCALHYFFEHCTTAHFVKEEMALSVTAGSTVAKQQSTLEVDTQARRRSTSVPFRADTCF